MQDSKQAVPRWLDEMESAGRGGGNQRRGGYGNGGGKVVTAMVIEAVTTVEAIIMVATMIGISAVGAGTTNGE